MIHKRIVRYGEYTTLQNREAYGRDVKSTHFKIGSSVDPSVTTYAYDYRQFGLDSVPTNGQGAKVADRRGLVFGTDKLQADSSYKLDYPPKQGGHASLNTDTLKDLRATHYALGSDPRSLNTTHKQDYTAPALVARNPNDIANRTRKMRMQNFRFGDDPVNYKTSAAEAYARRPRMASV
eukprot:TRINITY_DN10699_c0_g1_i4.p1 TRINITY_DN10699_c0_g1~~TRINITY_DN10699_c0_g1_i4.p1  ORF type:complete len:179 (+),score=36.62 TRINITY_DN10699_c0_g1_i4:76-612(+)